MPSPPIEPGQLQHPHREGKAGRQHPIQGVFVITTTVLRSRSLRSRNAPALEDPPSRLSRARLCSQSASRALTEGGGGRGSLVPKVSATRVRVPDSAASAERRLQVAVFEAESAINVTHADFQCVALIGGHLLHAVDGRHVQFRRHRHTLHLRRGVQDELPPQCNSPGGRAIYHPERLLLHRNACARRGYLQGHGLHLTCVSLWSLSCSANVSWWALWR